MERATKSLSTAQDSELREEIAARLATQLAGAAPTSRAAPITSRGRGSGQISDSAQLRAAGGGGRSERGVVGADGAWGRSAGRPDGAHLAESPTRPAGN